MHSEITICRVGACCPASISLKTQGSYLCSCLVLTGRCFQLLDQSVMETGGETEHTDPLEHVIVLGSHLKTWE